jgi:hypothetical protein
MRSSTYEKIRKFDYKKVVDEIKEKEDLLKKEAEKGMFDFDMRANKLRYERTINEITAEG